MGKQEDIDVVDKILASELTGKYNLETIKRVM